MLYAFLKLAMCIERATALRANFGTKFTEKPLKDGGDGDSKRHLKEIIFKIGRESLLASCAVVDKAPLVAKIAQEVGWEVVWDAALSRGGRSIKRLQLLVMALCHHCPDDPLACPYADGHLSGETLRQLEHSNFQILFQYSNVHFNCFSPVFVTLFLTFPSGFMR